MRPFLPLRRGFGRYISLLLLLAQGWLAAPLSAQAPAENGIEVKPRIARPPDGSAKKSEPQTTPLGGEAMPNQTLGVWQPVLQNPLHKRGGGDAEKKDEHLAVKKAKYLQKKQQVQHFDPNEECGDGGVSQRDGLPYIGANFEGNGENGCPPDNTLAISNGGYIVSCVNSNLYIYNQAGSLLSSTTLYNFFSALQPSPDLCDPKLIYDALADRYILYTQVCDATPSPRQVLLAFSKTNNPLNGWWVYAITGNPLNDFSWLDYPKIGVSNKEFYLTGNLYYGGSGGGYNQAVLYQIPKQAGYSGQSLNWQYWYEMDGNPFTLLPLPQGQGKAYGPGTYLVASRSGGGTSVQFYDLTDDMSASNEQLEYYQVSVPSYEVPPLAGQSSSPYPLDGGDCRTMDGFFLNGVAHFVFTVDNDNWASISYNRLKVSDLKVTQALTTFPGEKDYAYPSVASFAKDATDQSVLVGFLASGNDYDPEIRVKYYDNAMNTSSSILVKEGEGGIGDDCYNPDRELCRWGDYSGMSRKHNASTNTVWMSGCYGGWLDTWETWIAEVKDSGTPISTDDPSQAASRISTFPNPVRQQRFTAVMSANEAMPVVFQLLSANGSLVQDLYRGSLLPGDNQFSFHTGHLPPGTYMIRAVATNNNKIVAHEKIIVAP